ncbi:MAG: hypothetical protein WCS18_05190 [Sphaerochaetaceae bacterium]
MSNIKSAEHYEQAGDKLTGRPALSAYVHAQNDAMSPPVTPAAMDMWRRLQRKMVDVLDDMEASDANKGRATSAAKRASSRANGLLGGRPRKTPD